jgi:hypothetical protein
MFNYQEIVNKIINSMIPNKWRYLVISFDKQMKIFIDGNKLPNKALRRLFNLNTHSICCWSKKNV